MLFTEKGSQQLRDSLTLEFITAKLLDPSPHFSYSLMGHVFSFRNDLHDEDQKKIAEKGEVLNGELKIKNTFLMQFLFGEDKNVKPAVHLKFFFHLF